MKPLGRFVEKKQPITGREKTNGIFFKSTDSKVIRKNNKCDLRQRYVDYNNISFSFLFCHSFALQKPKCNRCNRKCISPGTKGTPKGHVIDTRLLSAVQRMQSVCACASRARRINDDIVNMAKDEENDRCNMLCNEWRWKNKKWVPTVKHAKRIEQECVVQSKDANFTVNFFEFVTAYVLREFRCKNVVYFSQKIIIWHEFYC